MKSIKKISVIALSALMLISTIAMTVSAAEGKVHYKGGAHVLTVTPNDTRFTESDMFAGFKGVMPGDHREEKIIVDCQKYYKDKSIGIYMQIVPHNAGNMPVVKDGTKDERDVPKSLMTVEEMKDLLSHMKLTVHDEKTGKDIYAGQASGAMSEAVLLGDFVKDKEHILTVLLDVDERLTGKKYENREAEVDFIFTVKEYENGGGGGGGGGGGVTPATPAEAAKPKTGDDIVIWPYILAVIAAAGIIVAVTVSKKKKAG